MMRAAPVEIVSARVLIRQAQEVAAAQEVFDAAEAAEAVHAFAPAGNGPKSEACGWCPARGMALPDGHPLCPCGTPRGDDCSEVGRTGAGAKGRHAGEIRHTRAQLAEAQEMAEQTAEAEEALLMARAALDGIAGEVAGTAALVAVRSHGERQAVAIVALLLGLPILPETEEREPIETTATLPARRERKVGEPVPTVAAIAIAQGAVWAHRTALPSALAVARDVAEGALALRALWADTMAEGWAREARGAAEALSARQALPAPMEALQAVAPAPMARRAPAHVLEALGAAA